MHKLVLAYGEIYCIFASFFLLLKVLKEKFIQTGLLALFVLAIN